MPKHPVPKKKTSKARGSRRYKSFQNKARKRLTDSIQIIACAKCSAPKQSHHVCKECGDFAGKDVLGKQQKAVEELTTIKAD